jgi:hypothetical protein
MSKAVRKDNLQCSQWFKALKNHFRERNLNFGSVLVPVATVAMAALRGP